MTAPANATIYQLLARIWRMRLARWAMRASRAFDDLAEWILPADLRRGRDDRGKRESEN